MNSIEENNIELRKEEFLNSIQTKRGFDNELWLKRLQLNVEMGSVVFSKSNNPPKNMEAIGIKAFFTEDSLIIIFDFEQFPEWAKGEITVVKLNKMVDHFFSIFDIGIQNWYGVRMKEVTYEQKLPFL